MKKKKSKKKLLIGAGVIAVVAVGGVSVLGGRSSGEEAVPQVEVVKAEIGDVQQTVELPFQRTVKSLLPVSAHSLQTDCVEPQSL